MGRLPHVSCLVCRLACPSGAAAHAAAATATLLRHHQAARARAPLFQSLPTFLATHSPPPWTMQLLEGPHLKQRTAAPASRARAYRTVRRGAAVARWLSCDDGNPPSRWRTPRLFLVLFPAATTSTHFFSTGRRRPITCTSPHPAPSSSSGPSSLIHTHTAPPRLRFSPSAFPAPARARCSGAPTSQSAQPPA